jgi:hypothetical protein
VGAPYQVALAASQLGSVVKADVLKFTGLAHEPYETRREKTSAPKATRTLDEAIIVDAILLATSSS